MIRALNDKGEEIWICECGCDEFQPFVPQPAPFRCVKCNQVHGRNEKGEWILAFPEHNKR